MTNRIKDVVIFGLGYIGLPTAALMAKKGFNVLGVDVNTEIIEKVNQGQIHIVEPDLEGLVKYVTDRNLLKASSQPQNADVFLIAVPTPFKENNIPDTSFIEAAAKMAIPYLKAGDLFIIESTSPIHTTERIASLIYKERPELEGKLNVAYCPERVLPGNIIYELENNDRVIGGIDEKSSSAAAFFYNGFVKAKLHITNSRTAEMCKLVENSSRDVNIAFANELSMICDKAEIDIWELINLANRHPRVNILNPGTGVGGHCIAVDPWFIVSEFPEEAKLIRKSREINKYKTLWVVEKVKNEIYRFKETHGRRPIVSLMGLAFKPNIDDLRESPAMEAALSLMDFKEADYRLVEPNVKHLDNLELSDQLDAYNESDIVVYLVAHNVFNLMGKDDQKIEMDFCGIKQ